MPDPLFDLLENGRRFEAHSILKTVCPILI